MGRPLHAPLNAEAVKKWTSFSWNIEGNLSVSDLRRGFLWFSFKLSADAERVLAKGKWSLLRNSLQLEK